MYAIVEIAGKQFKVQADDTLYVPHLQADAGQEVTFDRVLLVADDGTVNLGQPLLEDASVTAEVLEHVKGDKVMVFKKKRRKRYKVKRGHRQQYTQIQITDLNVTSPNGQDADSE